MRFLLLIAGCQRQEIDFPASADPLCEARWLLDQDGDGVGGEPITACEPLAGAVLLSGDCDDADPDIHPGALERCDGVDQDCDGEVDEGEAADGGPWYLDADGDGYGLDGFPSTACQQPAGYALVGGDCDDGSEEIQPAATEICDGVDNDCDGEVDGASAQDATTWAADLDGDGFGDPTQAVVACADSAGIAADATDCDDGDPEINPGATEGCDGQDDDCDGTVDFGMDVPADFASISEAIEAAADGDTICVSAGIWTGTLDLDNRSLRIIGIDGSSFTTLDGDGAGPVLQAEGGVLELAGFTITGGVVERAGGGLYLKEESALLRDLVIQGNEATSSPSGVGIYARKCALELAQVDLIDNIAQDGSSGWGTGGVFAQSQLLWSGGRVMGNQAGEGTQGGGIALTSITGTLENLEIVGNGDPSTVEEGGGIWLSRSDIDATNLVVSGNGAAKGGGIFISDYGTLNVENCDIVGNEAGLAGAIYIESLSESNPGVVALESCNIVGNSATAYSGVVGFGDSADLQAIWSNFYGNSSPFYYGLPNPTHGDGVLEVDPAYLDLSGLDPTTWDLQLDPGSPCVDAGSPDHLDADGGPADIGAYGGLGGDRW